MRQKNTSNPILILKPSSTGPTQADDALTFIPFPSITTIAKIEDTIELILQEGEAKAPPKVNKWHEKFAKSRIEKKN
jgi:sister chromatid cohesion protein DCC1